MKKRNNLSKFLKKTGTKISKHSPEILTTIGVLGMIASTALAVKETPKALKLIEDAKQEKGDKLTAIEKTKTCWKTYLPSAILGVSGAICVFEANSINTKRKAALATACALTETAFKEYKAEVIETIGEKKERQIKDKVAKKKVEKKTVNESSIIITNNGDTLFIDGITGRPFKSDIEKVKKAVNELNRRMIYENYISLNDFYNELGIGQIISSNLGDELGWNLDSGFIEPDFSAQITEDGKPCIVLGYLVEPRYDYSKLM